MNFFNKNLTTIMKFYYVCINKRRKLLKNQNFKNRQTFVLDLPLSLI